MGSASQQEIHPWFKWSVRCFAITFVRAMACQGQERFEFESVISWEWAMEYDVDNLDDILWWSEGRVLIKVIGYSTNASFSNSTFSHHGAHTITRHSAHNTWKCHLWQRANKRKQQPQFPLIQAVWCG